MKREAGSTELPSRAKEQIVVSDSLTARPHPQERYGQSAASHTETISNHFLALPICGSSKNGGNVRAKLVGVWASNRGPVTVTDRVSADKLAVHTTGPRASTINRFAAAAQLQTIGPNVPECNPGSFAPGHAELAVI